MSLEKALWDSRLFHFLLVVAMFGCLWLTLRMALAAAQQFMVSEHVFFETAEQPAAVSSSASADTSLGACPESP